MARNGQKPTAVIILCVLILALLTAVAALAVILHNRFSHGEPPETELSVSEDVEEYDYPDFAVNKDLPRLADNADLLTDEEERLLSQELYAARKKLMFDLVIVTVNTTDGKTMREFADEYYDRGYGCDEKQNGALLLVNMGEREWWIRASSGGSPSLSDGDIEMIGDFITPYLTDGAYYEAFSMFIARCDRIFTMPVYDSSADAG